MISGARHRVVPPSITSSSQVPGRPRLPTRIGTAASERQCLRATLWIVDNPGPGRVVAAGETAARPGSADPRCVVAAPSVRTARPASHLRFASQDVRTSGRRRKRPSGPRRTRTPRGAPSERPRRRARATRRHHLWQTAARSRVSDRRRRRPVGPSGPRASPAGARRAGRRGRPYGGAGASRGPRQRRSGSPRLGAGARPEPGRSLFLSANSEGATRRHTFMATLASLDWRATLVSVPAVARLQVE
jgi:hypothetical protein